MDTLPEALRDLAPVTHDMQHTFRAEILFEAADRIEALEAENAVLREALEDMTRCGDWPVFAHYVVRGKAHAALAQQTERDG